MTKRYGLALVVLSAALVSVGASARAASVPSTRVPVKVFFPQRIIDRHVGGNTT